MSELPEGWAQARLSDVADFVMGQSPPSNTYNKAGRGLPFFQGKAEFGRLYPTAVKFCSQPQKVARAEDVLISVRAPVGPTNLCAEESCIGRGLAAIRPLDRIPNRFLLYYLRSIEGWLSGQGTGSTFTAISKIDLEQLDVLLPPLNEQRSIVAKLEKLLSRVDAAQARLATILRILKRFRQSVLAAACSGRLTADWRGKNPNDEPAAELLKQIKEVRLRRASSSRETEQIKAAFSTDVGSGDEGLDVPATWAFCPIGAIGTVSNGSTPSRKISEYWNGNIHWVSSGEVRNNIISTTRECITKQGFNNSSVRLLPPGTVLLAMIGEGKTRGQTAILEIEGTINQNIAAIDVGHGCLVPAYLWRWFQYQYETTREQGSGSGPQALNCQRVRELSFYLPPLAEQQQIVRRVEALFKTADALEARYRKAKAHVDKLTQSILAKAFRGELVPQDPNDEPAAALLARIGEVRAQSVRSSKRI